MYCKMLTYWRVTIAILLSFCLERSPHVDTDAAGGICLLVYVFADCDGNELCKLARVDWFCMVAINKPR